MRVHRQAGWVLACALPFLPSSACPDDQPLSRARLAAERVAVDTGGTLTVGLVLTMAPGWHTYADPPGDSGMAPRIRFTAPKGVRAGNWRFPPPREFRDAAGVTYGYEDIVLLLCDLRIPPSSAAGGRIVIEADVEWLICKDVCIPFDRQLKLELPVAAQSSPGLAPDWKDLKRWGGWPVER